MSSETQVLKREKEQLNANVLSAFQRPRGTNLQGQFGLQFF